MFYVRSKGDTEAARAQILKLMPEYSVRSLAEYVTLMTSSTAAVASLHADHGGTGNWW